jgi:hypothetical protein
MSKAVGGRGRTAPELGDVSTAIIPEDLNVNPGQAVFSFNTENEKRLLLETT